MSNQLPQKSASQASPCPVDIALLRNTVGLCAFAVEARRVLEEVNFLCNHDPSINSVLMDCIQTMNEYAELPFPVKELLWDAHAKLDKLLTWEFEIADGCES